MAVLFISPLCPDRKEYQNNALNRSGNNVLLGIAENLYHKLGTSVEFICTPCVPSFPHWKLLVGGHNDKLDFGAELTFLPTLNIKVIKSKLWGISCKSIIKKWAKRHKGEELKVLIYNTYHPSVDEIYKACKTNGCELYAILYDLGVPPRRLGLSKLTMIGYEFAEKIAKRYIPKLDGRIVINECIAKDYAPDQDFILVDGGINNTLISKLPELIVSKNRRLECICAGMLWDQNGTKLILDTLAKYPDLDIVVKFAGRGVDVPLIEQAARSDNRIIYLGMLTLPELYREYGKADVLFNLRIEEETDYHFPSKLLECLATGKMVVSTPVAHAKRDYGQYMTILEDVSPEGLYHVLRNLSFMDKEELYHKGIAAREFMVNNRNWTRQTDRILEYMNCHK